MTDKAVDVEVAVNRFTDCEQELKTYQQNHDINDQGNNNEEEDIYSDDMSYNNSNNGNNYDTNNYYKGSSINTSISRINEKEEDYATDKFSAYSKSDSKVLLNYMKSLSLDDGYFSMGRSAAVFECPIDLEGKTEVCSSDESFKKIIFDDEQINVDNHNENSVQGVIPQTNKDEASVSRTESGFNSNSESCINSHHDTYSECTNITALSGTTSLLNKHLATASSAKKEYFYRQLEEVDDDGRSSIYSIATTLEVPKQLKTRSRRSSTSSTKEHVKLVGQMAKDLRDISENVRELNARAYEAQMLRATKIEKHTGAIANGLKAISHTLNNAEVKIINRNDQKYSKTPQNYKSEGTVRRLNRPQNAVAYQSVKTMCYCKSCRRLVTSAHACKSLSSYKRAPAEMRYCKSCNKWVTLKHSCFKIPISGRGTQVTIPEMTKLARSQAAKSKAVQSRAIKTKGFCVFC